MKHPISDLSELLFCEYKYYLLRVKKVKPTVTQKMKEGTKAHNELVELNKKKKEELKKKKEKYKDKVKDIKKSDLTKKEKEKKIKEIVKPPKDTEWREYKVIGKRLKGRIDEIKISDGIVYIIDDKSTDRAFDSDKTQVYGYCVAYLEQHPDENRVLECILRNHKTGVVFWRELFTDTAKRIVYELLDKMDGILKGEVTPVPTTSSSKCRYCNISNVCTKKVEDYDLNDMY